MKTIELENTMKQDYIYDYINYNGTRIKRIKKNIAPITYQGNKYFVPRANKSFASIETFYFEAQSNIESYNINSPKDIVIGITDSESKNISFTCDMQENIFDLFDEEIQNQIILSVFCIGKEMPIFQQHLSHNMDFEFAGDIELPAGRYLFIISGAKMCNSNFNHNENYIVLPLYVISAHASYNGIKEAKLSHYEDIIGTALPITIDLKHVKQTHNVERIKVMCIDSKMNVIDHKELYLFDNQKQCSCFDITPHSFWSKDENYTIILGDDKDARSTIKFSISNTRNCSINNSAASDDIINNFYKMVNENEHLQEHLYPIPGFSQIRLQAAALYGDKLHAISINNIAERYVLPTQHNLVVTSERPHFNKETLHPAIGVNYFVNNFTITEMVDCEELLAENKLDEIQNDNNCSIWYNLAALNKNRGKVLPYITEHLMDGHYVTLYDTTKNIKCFFETFPEITSFFDEKYTFHETEPTGVEMATKLIDFIKTNTDLTLTNQAIAHISHYMEKQEQQGAKFEAYNKDNIRLFTKAHIEKHVQKRLLASNKTDKDINMLTINHILPEDIDFTFFEKDNNRNNIDDVLHELNEMVGLNHIKECITDLSIQLQFNIMRRNMGFADMSHPCHHMIFTGNPGTGKTTVAKMIGKIFHSLGILSKGEVIVTDRTELLGSYIGHTEERMRDILQQAKGNVLFIDEAYSLCTNKDNNDFGKHVIEALLPVLANENSDMIVILAGYNDEMQRLLDFNPGLKGRFPHQWHFENYCADELMQIGCNLLHKLSYQLTDDAQNSMYKAIQTALKSNDKNFSNARWIKQQIVHNVLPAMAKRVMQTPHTNNANFFSTIENEDIAAIKCLVNNSKQQRNPIGFFATQQSVA